MKSEDELTGTAMVRLIVLEGWSSEGRDAHFLIGQDQFG